MDLLLAFYQLFSDPLNEEFAYMRLSAIAFNTIVEYLNLTSTALVAPIFRTALLNVLNDNTMISQQGQHVVNCYEVQRY